MLTSPLSAYLISGVMRKPSPSQSVASLLRLSCTDNASITRGREATVGWMPQLGVPWIWAPPVNRATGATTLSVECPTPSAVSLLDHAIGPKQQRRFDRQPERLGCLEVDRQLERRGLFNGQVGGFVATKNVVHEEGRTPKHVRDAGGV